jgi:hypothetical protein
MTDITEHSSATEAPLPQPRVAERDPAFVEVKDNSAREAAKSIEVRDGGAVFADWAQLVDAAKYMAASRHAIPKHLRENVGACIAVIDMATRWGFSHYQVARQCYLVNDMLAFESQLVHAVVEKFANLKYRLRPTYDGEGEARTCTITGHFRGEVDPLTYTTPLLGKITPKNSPLWKSDPDQQLFYFATQRWARRYCPDVLLGIYSVDDITDAPPLAADMHYGFENAKDISPKLAERLRTNRADEGFVGEQTIQSIDSQLAAATAPEPVKKTKKEESLAAGEKGES